MVVQQTENASPSSVFSHKKMSLTKTITIKCTLDCNLRCKYCYEFNRGNADLNSRINEKELSVIINRIAKLIPKSNILWLLHGGEPFSLGINFYRTFCDILRDVNNQYDVNFKTAIQTNGTLLNNDWIKLIEDNSHILSERILSLSIDGPKKINDEVRVMLNHKSAYDTLIENIAKIKQSNFSFTTISVIGKHNINQPDTVYNHIRDLQPLFAKFIPCYNFNRNGQVEKYGISPIEFAEFMCKVFDIWINDEKHNDKFRLDPIISIISNLIGERVLWCEYRKEKCDNFVTIFPNGDMWLCDVFNQDTMKDEAYLGNVFTLSDDDLVSVLCTPSNKCLFNEMYKRLSNKCTICDINVYCYGGCITERYLMQKLSPKLFQEYCNGKHILINHIKNAVEQIKD